MDDFVVFVLLVCRLLLRSKCHLRPRVNSKRTCLSSTFVLRFYWNPWQYSRTLVDIAPKGIYRVHHSRWLVITIHETFTDPFGCIPAISVDRNGLPKLLYKWSHKRDPKWRKKTNEEKPQVLSFHDIFTTHIFRLEKMQASATDLDPKPFDFLCWGPLMSSPLGLPCKQKPPTCEVQSWTLWAENWQGGFLLGCWERCCGFFVEF